MLALRPTINFIRFCCDPRKLEVAFIPAGGTAAASACSLSAYWRGERAPVLNLRNERPPDRHRGATGSGAGGDGGEGGVFGFPHAVAERYAPT